MRLNAFVVLGAVLLAAACASMGSPPGGPERTEPPALLDVTPDSGSVNVRPQSVVFEFDVVVNDRSGGAGGIESLFLVSPSEGAPRVRWRRSRVEVRPRENFRPNTAYSVTMLPGISDLRGNQMRAGRTIVFSTGPTIPPYAVMGRVFDWASERVAPNAFVVVTRIPDSVRYVGSADSTGQFAVGPLEEGAYIVRAIVDNNRNRAADVGEPWDSLMVTIRGTSPFIEVLAALRDTLPPRLLTVSAQDTLTLLASFDRPLDPAVPPTPALFRVQAADSSRLGVVSVRTRAQATAEAARRDSIVRRDSIAADTARRDTTRARPPVTRPVTPSATQAPPPRPSRPAPARDFVIRLDSATPMRRGQSYRVTAVNATGLLGRTATTDRVITMPLPSSRDTARATPRDTTRARPTTPPPGARNP